MKHQQARQKKKKRKVSLGVYVDPLSDSSFKRIFGREPNKELLIDFLNQLLKSKGKQITELTYNKNEYPSSLEEGRNTICDLTCRGKKGERFIIEVQKVYKEYFKDRTILYVSDLISELGKPGRDWNYELPEVYFIGLMDFRFKDSRPDRYLHRVHLREDDLPGIFYKKLSFIFIEVPSFNKGLDELDSELDKWLYVLKNMSKLREIPVILSSDVFKKVFEIAEVSKLTEEELMRYKREQIAQWDTYADLDTAKKEGMEIGEEKGIAIGKEKIIRNLVLL